MKYVIIFSLLLYPFLSFSDQGQNEISAKGIVEPYDTAIKIEEPRSSPLIYDLPLVGPQGVTVTQGPLNPTGSHGYLNCLFAIDLASVSPVEDTNKRLVSGKILAAREGDVIAVHSKENPATYYNCDPSGDGFGNWIAIRHEFNEVSFYAHLNQIFVQIGDHVERGQEIGLEGATGQAGFRHLHFSVHRLIGDPSKDLPPYYSSQYECIPYRLQYVDERIKVTDVREFSKINNRILGDNPLPKLYPVAGYAHPLLTSLKEMYKEDQDACSEWIQASEDKKEAAGNIVMEIRRNHNPILKELIQKNGWPAFETIGVEGSDALWLLVQHQDEDLSFQKECLNLLKDAVDKDQANFKSYAYLLDRTRMNEKLPQVYGTQWIGEKGEITLYEVENPDELDQRLLNAGLPTIYEYKKLIQEAYDLTEEDFKN